MVGKAHLGSGYLESLRRDGYVVVQNLIPPEQLARLREASSHITTLARNNDWPHIRAVPKQYPPWPSNAKGTNIWGVQHLLHPDMPNRRVFAELYFSDAVLDIVKELVGTKDEDYPRNIVEDKVAAKDSGSSERNVSSDDHGTKGTLKPANATDKSSSVPAKDDGLVMELFNLLISPGSSTDFELCWHRDDIKPNITQAEELAQLQQKSPQTGPQLHAQYNIALYEDASLIAIPGSHARIRSEVEREASPYQPDLPGQVTVRLGPGDGVFYDSNILHRGAYAGIDEHVELGRMTLHGSVGLAGHGNERARQVLQHAVGQWVHLDTEKGFGLEGHLGARAGAMRDRLVAMGKGEDVGYSLDG